MNNQPRNRVKYSSKKVLKYCKYYRKGFCRFGDRCCFIHDPSVILPCPYGANCSHDDCWYSHSDPYFTSKIDDLINEVEALKKRLTLMENRKFCECHHCPTVISPTSVPEQSSGYDESPKPETNICYSSVESQNKPAQQGEHLVSPSKIDSDTTSFRTESLATQKFSHSPSEKNIAQSRVDDRYTETDKVISHEELMQM